MRGGEVFLHSELVNIKQFNNFRQFLSGYLKAKGYRKLETNFNKFIRGLPSDLLNKYKGYIAVNIDTKSSFHIKLYRSFYWLKSDLIHFSKLYSNAKAFGKPPRPLVFNN